MNHDSATSTVSIPLPWREFVRAIADLPSGAEPNLNGMRSRASQLLAGPVQEQAAATAELLKMLSQADPFASGQQSQWFERLCAARAVQQPLPVPQGAVVIWRCDLVRAVAELLQLRAYRDLVKAKGAREASKQPSAAARDVLAERRRQVEQEGYDHEHDDAHPSGEIAAYAAFYAMPPAAREWPATETGYGDTFGEAIVPADWKVPKEGDRRAELVKAGALILAEIERIDRAAMAVSPVTTEEKN